MSELAYGTARARWVLLATVLASGLTMLDGTVVNVALPAIGRDLHAAIDGLQWTVDGYTLTPPPLIPRGGPLRPRFGPPRILLVAATWLALASLLSAIVPTLLLRLPARAL